MRAPVLRATIERRLLVNYRVDVDVLRSIVPACFRPTTVYGFGMAGICLIRLGDIRPLGLPATIGLTAENAAHRVAVEWDTANGPVQGVYIPRRDTSSRLIALLGGRVFPGWHHLAGFDVDERDGHYRIALTSRDGQVSVGVSARRAEAPMPGSLFTTTDEASSFFRCAPVGYAATPSPEILDGVELETCGWGMEPLVAEEVRSSFFDDRDHFPTGTATLDSAFLMERIDTTWTARPRLLARVPTDSG
jgi:hypothetical protein